jgi:hypothetical protein
VALDVIVVFAELYRAQLHVADLYRAQLYGVGLDVVILFIGMVLVELHVRLDVLFLIGLEIYVLLINGCPPFGLLELDH